MYDSTKLLSRDNFNKLVALLPTPRQKKRGRKKVQKEPLIRGILQVLVNGVAWKKIADCGSSYISCWRYLEELQRRGKLKLIHHLLAKQKTDITDGAIDTTTIDSFEFQYLSGWDGWNHKMGVKVSLFTGKKGLPADVAFGKGNLDDKRLIPIHLDNTRGIRKKQLTLDKKYMSIPLRRELRKKKIRANMKWREQDFKRKRGPKFKLDEQSYAKRFELERTNGWLKAFRSLRLRRSYHPAMFKALVYLALIIILIRSK